MYLENFAFQLSICSSFPVKFSIFLKCSLLFKSFYCLFLFTNKTLWLKNSKIGKLQMRNFQCLIFMLMRSYIFYYIICVTVPLNLSNFPRFHSKNQWWFRALLAAEHFHRWGTESFSPCRYICNLWGMHSFQSM